MFDFLSKITLQLNGFRCADNDLATTDEYFDPRLDWKTTLNGKRYELVLRFAYVEHFLNGDTIEKFIDWDLGDQTSVNTDGGENMFKVVSGSSFFEMLQGRLSSYDLEDQVVKRTFNSKAIEFILTAEVIHSMSKKPHDNQSYICLLYTSPSPRDVEESRMPSSA